MESKLKLPECSICTEFIDDPRPLPCGHSYCGPPKSCLDALKSEYQLKCALCNCEHQIDIADIKPMYGLREFLKEQKGKAEKSSKKELSDKLCCFDHPNSPITLWCKKCLDTVCVMCLESDQHSDHHLISFRKNLKSIIGEKISEVSPDREIFMSILDQTEKKISKKCKNYETEAKIIAAEKQVNEDNWNQIQMYSLQQELDADCELLMWFFRGNFENCESNTARKIVTNMYDEKLMSNAGTQTVASKAKRFPKNDCCTLL